MGSTELRAAAQQTLEALEAIREADTAGATPKMVVEARKMYEPAITALRAALAEEALQRLTDVSQEIEAALAAPVQEPVACNNTFACRCPKHYTAPPHRPAEPVQEPVAWAHNLIDNIITHRPADIDRHPDRWTPLYTSPPQRKPLTEEEIDSIWDSEKAFANIYAIARAVEQAHGIGS